MAHAEKQKSKETFDGFVTAAAQDALRDRYEKLLKLMDDTVKSDIDNREVIHKLRVAARRAAAALELYESWLPKHRSKKLKKFYKKAREAAAQSRDLDVFLEYLATNARHIPPDVFMWLIRHAAFQRCAAQSQLQRDIKHLLKKKIAKRGDIVLAKIRWRDEGNEPSLQQHAAAVLQDLVEELARQHKKEHRQARELHVVRVLCKRVRYTLELLNGALPHSLAASMEDRLSAIQDRLGQLNDAAMVIERLKTWQDDCRDKVLAELLQRVTEREVETVAEKTAAMIENLPHEIAPLVTMLRQLAPAA